VSLHSTGYEVGDLVILLHSIDWIDFSVFSGELAIIMRIYPKKSAFPYDEIYDCRLKFTSGGEMDVWFGEIRKLIFEENE
tara:strand:+ start:445 stop:684 length:240 start_codon:yes stop_codon:yes gene_type:complete